MPTTPQPYAPGTLLAGKLRIVRQLGVGGMGAVYEIEHELTKHRRALKLLHAEVLKNAGAVERFLREASAAGRIGDPHIVETFDAGTLESGEPYVVMEMLEGEDLAHRLEARGRLDLGELCELVGQACLGVQAAHDAGIVHRDLKPENLFVVTRGGAPFVKILDFGVSKFDLQHTAGMAVTREGTAIGTPLYMPPEQIRGERDLDARADVYALGVILYECAAGKPPFDAVSLMHLALLIQEGTVAPLASLRPDLPPVFHALVARAMAVDRLQRFPSARELGRALAEVAARTAAAFADTATEADLGGPAPPAAPAVTPPSSADLAGAAPEARDASPVGESPRPPRASSPPSVPPPSAPRAAREPGGLAVGARTSTGGLASRPPPRPASTGRGLVAAAVVLALGGGAALALSSLRSAPRSGASTDVRVESAASSSPPASSAPVVVVGAPFAPAVAAEVPDAGAAPPRPVPADPGTHAGAPAIATAAASPAATATRKAGPAASSPASTGKLPLATENPFR